MPINEYSITPNDNTGLIVLDGANPSTVDNAIRQLAADAKASYQDHGWANLGNPSGVKTCSYVSNTAISLGGNQTGDYHVGRRIRVDYAASSSKYGKITASVYDGSTATTVTIQTDDGSSLTNAAGTPFLGPSAKLSSNPAVVDAYYSGSGTVRILEIRVNDTMIGGIDWNGSVLSLVTD